MTPRTYTDEEKAEAIALYVEVGPSEASRRLDIGKTTIASWAYAIGARTNVIANTEEATAARMAQRADTRERLRSLLLEKATDMLERMDDEHVDYRGKDADRVTWDRAPAADCARYATAAAILLDKYRLEVGESTDRQEIRDGRERVLSDARDRALNLVPRAS